MSSRGVTREQSCRRRSAAFTAAPRSAPWVLTGPFLLPERQEEKLKNNNRDLSMVRVLHRCRGTTRCFSAKHPDLHRVCRSRLLRNVSSVKAAVTWVLAEQTRVKPRSWLSRPQSRDAPGDCPGGRPHSSRSAPPLRSLSAPSFRWR